MCDNEHGQTWKCGLCKFRGQETAQETMHQSPKVQQASSEPGHQGPLRGSAGSQRNHEEASGPKRLSCRQSCSTLEKGTP